MNRNTLNFVFVILITAITKLLGLVKQIVIANYYGMTADTDAFMLISGTINDIGIAIFSALSIVFLADFIKKKNTTANVDLFASNVLAFFSVVLLFVVILIEIFAPQVVKLIAPGFSQETAALSTRFVIILAPMLMVLCIRTILTAVLDSEKHFWYGKSLGAFQSIVLIVLTVLFYKTGIYILVIGLVVAYLLEVVVGLFFVLKKKYYQIVTPNNIWNDETKTLLLCMLPLFLSNSVSEVNALVARGVCSNFGEGVVTSLSYAQTLKQFVNSILISSTLTVLYTNIVSKSIQADSKKSLSDYVSKSILIYIIILVPVTLVALFSATDIVRIVFGHGAVSEYAVNNTANALIGYAYGFIPLALVGVVLRVYYSNSNTTFPLICSIITVTINVVLILVLSDRIGIMGVSLAASLSTAVSFFLLLFKIRRYIDKIDTRQVARSLSKVLMASLVTIGIVLFVNQFINCPSIFKLLLNIFIVFGSFYLLLYVLKSEELKYLSTRIIPNRFRKI